jgi:hypothetical protein
MADARTATLNAARTKPGSHAGPHGSFPITDDKSVNSAYRLAGHAAKPDAVRAKIKELADKKGLSGALPKTAKRSEKSPVVRTAGMARMRVGQ